MTNLIQFAKKGEVREMTDDLVKRLREADIYDYDSGNEICGEAADRIEQLEAELRQWACACATVDHCKWSQINCPHFVARAVLRGEKI